MTTQKGSSMARGIFVVDGNLTVHQTKVPFDVWEGTGDYLTAFVGGREVICLKGRWEWPITFAAFPNLERAKGFMDKKPEIQKGASK